VARSVGCDDFLRKPFKEAELFEMMHKYLGVQYVYEEGEGQKAKDERQVGAGPLLTPTALAALPADVLAKLEQTTLRSDVELTAQIIQEIRPHDPTLAGALERLADNFAYDQILRLIQKAKGVKSEE
jgi:hypothetical protein